MIMIMIMMLMMMLLMIMIVIMIIMMIMIILVVVEEEMIGSVLPFVFFSISIYILIYLFPTAWSSMRVLDLG